MQLPIAFGKTCSGFQTHKNDKNRPQSLYDPACGLNELFCSQPLFLHSGSD